MRTTLAVLLALLTTGCCCRTAAPPTTAQRETVRRFVVVRATPLEERDEGKRQLLLESSVVEVRRAGSIAALDSAQRMDTKDAPVWLAGTQVPEATFGRGSKVLTAPSIVTADGEEAAIEILKDDENDALDGLQMRMLPTLDAEGALSLQLFYKHLVGGRIERAVPGVTLEGPTGHVFIVEALPPR